MKFLAPELKYESCIEEAVSQKLQFWENAFKVFQACRILKMDGFLAQIGQMVPSMVPFMIKRILSVRINFIISFYCFFSW